MFQIPLRDDFKRRRFTVGKREGDFPKLFDQRSLRRPIRSDDFVVIASDHLLNRALGPQQIVRRRGEHALLLQYTSNFWIETIVIQPMYRLSHQHERETSGW